MPPNQSIAFAPEIDERQLDRSIDEMNRELERAGGKLEAEIGIDDSMGGRGGGGGGAGAGAAAGLASRIPKPVAGAGVAAALPVALGGAIGVGMLSAMQGASAQLQTSTALIGQAWNNVWRPLGDDLDQLFVRDLSEDILRATQDFEDTWVKGNRWDATTTLLEDLLEAFTGDEERAANRLGPSPIGALLGEEAQAEFEQFAEENNLQAAGGGGGGSQAQAAKREERREELARKTWERLTQPLSNDVDELFTRSAVEEAGGIVKDFKETWLAYNPGERIQSFADDLLGYFPLDIIDDVSDRLSDFVDDFEWSDVTDRLEWPAFVDDVPWKGIINTLKWGPFIPIVAWSEFVEYMDWAEWLDPLNWPEFISNIDWGERIPDFPGWPDVREQWPGFPEIGQQWRAVGRWPDVSGQWDNIGGWPNIGVISGAIEDVETAVDSFVSWVDNNLPGDLDLGGDNGTDDTDDSGNDGERDDRGPRTGGGEPSVPRTGGGSDGSSGGGDPNPGTGGSGSATPQMQTGGRVDRSGAAVVHEGERVLPDAQVSDRGEASFDPSSVADGFDQSSRARDLGRKLDQLHRDMQQLMRAIGDQEITVKTEDRRRFNEVRR